MKQDTAAYTFGTRTGIYPPNTTAELLSLLRSNNGGNLLQQAAISGHLPPNTSDAILHATGCLEVALDHNHIPPLCTPESIAKLKRPNGEPMLHYAVARGHTFGKNTREELEALPVNTGKEVTNAWQVCLEHADRHIALLTQYPSSNYAPKTTTKITNQLANTDTTAALTWLLPPTTPYPKLPPKAEYFEAAKTGQFPPHALTLAPHLFQHHRPLLSIMAQHGNYPPGTTITDLHNNNDLLDYHRPHGTTLHHAIEYNHYPPNTTVQDLAKLDTPQHNYLFLAISKGHLPPNTTEKDLQTSQATVQGVESNHQIINAWDLTLAYYNANKELIEKYTQPLTNANPFQRQIRTGTLPDTVTKEQLQNVFFERTSAWELCLIHADQNTKFLRKYPPSTYDAKTIKTIIEHSDPRNMATAINWFHQTPNQHSKLPTLRAYQQAPRNGKYPPGATLTLLAHLPNDPEFGSPALTATHTGKYPPNTTFEELAAHKVLLTNAIKHGNFPETVTKEKLEATPTATGNAWTDCITCCIDNAEFLATYPASNYNVTTAHIIAKTLIGHNSKNCFEAAAWLEDGVKHHLQSTIPTQPAQTAAAR